MFSAKIFRTQLQFKQTPSIGWGWSVMNAKNKKLPNQGFYQLNSFYYANNHNYVIQTILAGVLQCSVLGVLFFWLLLPSYISDNLTFRG